MCVLFIQAMQIFFDAYASEAGNAMLKWLPTGGFYITGGIAAKNLKYIADSPRMFFGTVHCLSCVCILKLSG